MSLDTYSHVIAPDELDPSIKRCGRDAPAMREKALSE
jgi:hypothetical protein